MTATKNSSGRDRWRNAMRSIAGLFLTLGIATAARADDQAARELYIDTCGKCHGALATDPVAGWHDGFVIPAVTMPLGPPLAGIYGRVAGTYEGYAYSRAFLEMAQNPWTWGEDELDLWLTDTQAFIRGSTMFLKVPDAGERAAIIGYLRKYAPHTSE